MDTGQYGMRNVRQPCSLTLPRSAVPHMSPSLPISPLRMESARMRINTHQCLEIHRATSGKRASASIRPADLEMHGSETNKDRREDEQAKASFFAITRAFIIIIRLGLILFGRPHPH